MSKNNASRLLEFFRKKGSTNEKVSTEQPMPNKQPVSDPNVQRQRSNVVTGEQPYQKPLPQRPPRGQKKEEKGKEKIDEGIQPPPRPQHTTPGGPPKLEAITKETLANAFKGLEKSNPREFRRLSLKIQKAEQLPQKGVQPEMVQKINRALLREIETVVKLLPNVPPPNQSNQGQNPNVIRPTDPLIEQIDKLVEKNQFFVEGS